MLAPHSAGSSESARKMASHGSFQSLGSAKSEPAEWLPNRWGESYRLGDLGADQAPEGPAAKPRTFAEFRPEESRPGWLGGVGAVGGERPAFVGGRDDGASYPYPAILSDPVSDEMSSERGLAYRAAYQQYRRGFAEGASGERPRAAPTPPRHTPSPPPLPRRTDRGHASSLVGPLIAEFSDAVAREVSDKIRHALDRDVGPERLRRFLDDGADGLRDEVSALREENRRLARENARLDAARRDYSPPPPGREPANPYDRGHPNGGAPKPFAPPRQTGEGYDGGDAPNFDAMREDLHGALSRLSTLEGRQRALQGKIAKLDGQWGGDCTQMTHTVCELQRIVATKYYHRDPETVTEISALRGQLIALAHSIDKLDQRTLAIESDAVVTIDGVTQPPQRGPGGA